MQASARVQQTGSAYVAAIAALGRMAAEGDGEDASQGREAALAALYAAALQLSRLDPNDPLAARILQGLEDVRTAESAGAARERERQVVWF